MGFLDKVKSTVEKTTKTAQSKLDDVQAKKRADHLVRELGAAYYAARQAGGTEADAEVERIVAELQAHEAEHGAVSATASEAPSADQPAPAPEDSGDYKLDEP